MFCPSCDGNPLEGSRFCPQCGKKLPPPKQPTGHPATASPHELPIEGSLAGTSSWGIFWLTLIGSLTLSWVLSTVFHLPFFFLGLFLPLIWWQRPKH